jgi:calcineurin-like phosphoesterase family protein
MKKNWFIGCTHFGHRNIIKYCNRPFSTVKEMDDCIFQNINDRVGPADNLFILGDFAMGPRSYIEECVQRLPTKNLFLIKGNHDKLSNLAYTLIGFRWVKDLYEVDDTYICEKTYQPQPKKLVLCHYPMESWNKSFHGSWHLHAHTHTSMPDNPNRLRMNVGVDTNDFAPVETQEVAKFMFAKNPVFDC